MRVRFEQAVREGWGFRGQVAKAAGAPPGYTPHTVVTEWLTLNCVGAWACRRRAGRVEVLFARAEDAQRAQGHFAALGLWR